jgi:hypothetical protein
MKQSSIPEVLAALGVIVSLIFVGVEIRQNTAAARGATFQAISDGAAQSAFDAGANDHIPKLFAQIRASDPPLSEFSAEDQERLRFIYLFTVRRLENVWVQVNEGVVDQGAFDRFQPRVGYVGSRSFRDFWSDGKPAFSSDFVSHFETLYPILAQ